MGAQVLKHSRQSFGDFAQVVSGEADAMWSHHEKLLIIDQAQRNQLNVFI